MILLKRMCKDNDIFLEELPKRLKLIETRQLFEKYNKIKERILSNPKNREELEEMLIEIRNQIVLGHMRLLHHVINRSIPDIKNRKDKEDIYQYGYETLIEFVERYDSTKDVSFMFFVREYIMNFIVTKIGQNNGTLNKREISELTKLNRARIKLDKLNLPKTIENLAKETDFTTKRVKVLIEIENFILPSTIDLEESELDDELIDYDFEDRMIDTILNQSDYLNKLMDALPEQENTVIRLMYGYVDGKGHSQEEVSKILGNISRERVRQVKENALGLLANSIGSNYLKDIYGSTPYSKNSQDGIVLLTESQRLFEDLAIYISPKETVISIINNLNPINREIMLLYYGLKDEIQYDIDEISKILNINKLVIKERKRNSTYLLIKGLVKKQNPSFKGNYLEYIINNYLNTPLKKSK